MNQGAQLFLGDRVQVDLGGFILNLHQEAPAAEFPLNSA